MVPEKTINKLLRSFPNSYINENEEFIAHEKANQYFLLYTCETDLDVKCKVIEWLSRGAVKAEPFDYLSDNRKLHEFMLNGINSFLGTHFNEEEMDTVYTYLGNCCNHKNTLKFIESGYKLEALQKYTV